MMSEEEINNYPNNSYHTTDDYHKQQQDVVTGGQLEQISKFLLECPEAALNVHRYLQKHYGDQQQQLFTPVNPTSKRDRPLDDSGGSIPNESRRWKQCRRGYHQNTQNYTHDAQQDTSIQPRPQLPLLPSDVQLQRLVSNQSVKQRKRLSFEQLKYAVSSNLPCFHVQFAADADRKAIPSALHASDMILNELQSNGVVINRFTLVGWTG